MIIKPGHIAVKTLHPHQNSHGKNYRKQKGDIYPVPEREGKTLIGLKYVERYDQGKIRGRKADRKKSVKTENSDGKSVDPESGKKGSATVRKTSD